MQKAVGRNGPMSVLDRSSRLSSLFMPSDLILTVGRGQTASLCLPAALQHHDVALVRTLGQQTERLVAHIGLKSQALQRNDAQQRRRAGR